MTVSELKRSTAKILRDLIAGRVSCSAAVMEYERLYETLENDDLKNEELLHEAYSALGHYRDDEDVRAIDDVYAAKQRAYIEKLAARLDSE